MPARRTRLLITTTALLAAAATSLLAGCAKSADLAAQRAHDAGRLSVVAGFYPFAYLAERVGGAHVVVQNLTKPGAEPHDLELTPSQVASIATADVAIFEKDLQPGVDTAIAQNRPKAAVDIASVIHLEDHGDLGEDPAPGTGSGSHAHGADPHVWLDPVDFAKAADAVTATLVAQDPAHAADYRANGAALDADLTELDAEYRAGLAHCTRKTIVTSHAAFGYLAERYGLTQVPIAGLSPEDEPSAAHLAQIQKLIKTEGVTTVFFETLASPKTAESLAHDTGTTAAVLDPIEGVADPTQHDYLSVMRDNLAALKTALGCS